MQPAHNFETNSLTATGYFISCDRTTGRQEHVGVSLEFPQIEH